MARARKRPSRWRKFSRRTPPGASPGTIMTDPAAPPTRISIMGFGPEATIERHSVTPDEAFAEVGRHAVVWVNVDGLGDGAAITRLGDLFGLHKLALEDVVNTHQRAKVETYGEQVFIVLREAALLGTGSENGGHPVLDLDQVSIFIGKNFLITFQERHGDSFNPVRERIRKHKGRICHERPDYLAYALIDAIIDAFYPVLENYGEQLEALEDETIDHASRRTVERIHEIKREFLSLRRAIWPAREAVGAIIREDLPGIRPDTKVYFRDCYDHLVQLIDMLETYRETSGDLMEVYLSSVSNRMNEVMKVLTIISTIFMPLTFIAGIYGMNFHTEHPLNMPELSWRYGYLACLAVMLVVTMGMLVYFRRKGWIGRGRSM